MFLVSYLVEIARKEAKLGFEGVLAGYIERGGYSALLIMTKSTVEGRFIRELGLATLSDSTEEFKRVSNMLEGAKILGLELIPNLETMLKQGLENLKQASPITIRCWEQTETKPSRKVIIPLMQEQLRT